MTGDQVEQSGFAGTVGSNDCGDGVLLNGEADVVGSNEAGKGLAQLVALKHQARAPRSNRPHRISAAKAPATPPGDANRRTRRTMPSTSGQNSVYETMYWLSRIRIAAPSEGPQKW